MNKKLGDRRIVVRVVMSLIFIGATLVVVWRATQPGEVKVALVGLAVVCALSIWLE